MQQFVTRLDKLRDAKGSKQHDAAVKKANAVMAKMLAAKAIPLKADDEPDDDGLDYYVDTYGDWVRKIPAKRKKRKQHFAALIEITSVHNKIANDSKTHLVKEIQRCKKMKELKHLRDGHTMYHHVSTPTLDDRLHWLGEEAGQSYKKLKRSLDQHYKKKHAYLAKKQIADRVALALTVILSILGVGLTCGIAMILILPVMPLAILIPVLVGFTLLGGYVEGFVFYNYVRRFCRNFVRGFWDTIDNNILNREAVKQFKLNDRNDLSTKQRLNILLQSKVERVVKKTLTIVSIPLALAAGVGFTALIFGQVASLLPLLGIIGGVVGIAAPWALAAVVGPLYAIIMYIMIYQAIKNNIFVQIKNHFIDLFAYKSKNGEKFSEISHAERAKHIGFCILKGFGIAIVLGVSILATVFTAGAWLQSSVNFFVAAFGLVESVATAIGYAIGVTLLATNLWFSIENSLETVKTFTKITWKKVKAAAHEFVKHPGRSLLGLLDLIPFSIHVAGTGAVGTQGTELFAFEEKIGRGPAKLLSGLISIKEEILVDAHAMPFVKSHDDDHHDDCHHGGGKHNHGSIVKLIESGIGFFSKKHHHDDEEEVVSLPRMRV